MRWRICPIPFDFEEESIHFRSCRSGHSFRDEGIDYLTSQPDDSRSWRWDDIRTLSNPDAYHLILFGYRDTYSFDLKQPLTQELFDRLSDQVYTHNVNDSRQYERMKP